MTETSEEIYWKAVVENMPALVASLSATALGLALIIDDARDFGKSDRPHHYMYGLVPLAGGMAGLSYTAYQIVNQANQMEAKQRKQPSSNQPSPPPANDEMKKYSPELIKAMR